MSWISIMFIITLIINVIILYLLRNSHEYNKEPIKFPLFIYLLGIIILLIPILNAAATIVLICGIVTAYGEGCIKFNEDFWLAKKY